jgi:predicted alpha/beta superfamily hydrolase
MQTLATMACAEAVARPSGDAGAPEREAGESVDGSVAAIDGGSPRSTAWRLVVAGVPDHTPADATLSVAGSFNAWNPASDAHRLTRQPDGTWTTVLAPGSVGARVEFKLTRGSWASVEKGHRLEELPNRVATYDPQHPDVAAYVERWADLPPASTTAHGRLELLRDVEMPQLGVRRTIRVLLPPGYEGSAERYPVLYMYDGQNLFDRVTSAFGDEWRVDEALGALVHEGRLGGIIVVGLDNSASRGCEYAVFPDDPHPYCAEQTAKGALTNAFLVDTLKPQIDARYRTKPDRSSTAVAGSSMGGQMALHAALTYSAVFSRVAALSPSFQNTTAGSMRMASYAREKGARGLRVAIDMGDAETIRDLDNQLLVGNMRAVAAALRDASAEVRDVVVTGGRHNERDWAARLPGIVLWLWPAP